MSDLPPYIHIGPEPELPPRMRVWADSAFCAPVIHRPSVIAPISLPEPETPKKTVAEVMKEIRANSKMIRKIWPKLELKWAAKKPRRTYKRPPKFRRHGKDLEIFNGILKPTEKASAAMEELGIVPTPKPSMLESMVEVTKKKSRSEQIKEGHARKAAELGLTPELYQEHLKIQRRMVNGVVMYTVNNVAKVVPRSPTFIRDRIIERFYHPYFQGQVRLTEAEFNQIVAELTAPPAPKEVAPKVKAKPGRKKKAVVAVEPEPKPSPFIVERVEIEVPLKTVATDSSIAQLQARLLGPAARIEKDDPEPPIARESLASNAQNKCCDRCGKIIWANPNKDGTMGTWLTNGYPHFPSFCIVSDQRGTVAPITGKKGRK